MKQRAIAFRQAQTTEEKMAALANVHAENILRKAMGWISAVAGVAARAYLFYVLMIGICFAIRGVAAMPEGFAFWQPLYRFATDGFVFTGDCILPILALLLLPMLAGILPAILYVVIPTKGTPRTL